jgi:D-serine deaminase-like pyridoxal phosphate-dependent protein
MHYTELDTPALVIDLDVLERNVTTLQSACDRLEIDLRVHTKTHKTPRLAQLQIDHGAIGICSQKLGEAAAMAAGGIKDILIPYNIIGAAKLKRLSRLIQEADATLTLSADNETVVAGLSSQAARDGLTIRVLVEMDSGMGRCGTQSPQQTLELAHEIDRLPGLEFMGVMTYPSMVSMAPFIDEVRTLMDGAGLPLHMVSGGGTGEEEISKALGCTEVRIGSYVYEGMTRIKERSDLNPERCSLRLVVTVVSAGHHAHVIVDAGMKALASYPPIPYGYCIEYPEVWLEKMYVEHGEVNVVNSSHRFEVGDVMSFIPLHGGMTTNLHDRIFPVRNGEVVDEWEVAGRGRSQ